MPTAPDLAGLRVTVMGLGRFGGGLGLTRWLVAQGADVLLTDLLDENELAEPLSHLRGPIDSGQITLRLGAHNVSDFTTADLVVANPAVAAPWDNRFLRAARAARVPITTEIRLLIEGLPPRCTTIGVTGTAGKSTTSAMIHCALAQLETSHNRVHLGGNIGGSLLEELGRINDGDLVVLELSSAQLYWLGDASMSAAPPWSPDIAVVTNFAPNHLDWHTTLDHYRTSKQQILAHQRVADARVLPRSLINWHTECEVDGLRLYPVDDDLTGRVPPLSIPGAHNRRNAAMALAVVEALGFDADEAARAIATFAGLPHRLEFAGEYVLPQGGTVRALNDSKCTTPQACVLALEAFSRAQGEVGVDRVRLIVGGYDKQADLTPMIEAAVPCAGVYAIGATGQGLTRSLKDAGATATYFDTLDSAVRAMVEDASDGEVLLLSPGCASWGQFRNYEQRGKAFVEAVRAHLVPVEEGSGRSHAGLT